MLCIVFVCTGNICRSPMAEGIFKYEWQKSMATEIAASSMGTHGLDNQPASTTAIEMCQEHHIDLSAHRSRRLVMQELEAADFIFHMEKVHQDFLHLFFPGLDEKSKLLGAWPEIPTKSSNIRDPYGASPKVYREIFNEIQSHIQRIIPLLSEYTW